MKKQLLALAGAAALGLGAIAGNTAPSAGVDPTAQVGYVIAKKAKAGPGGQAFAQGAGAGAGALLGAMVGAKVGTLAGPIGSIIGAGIGAY